MQSGHSFATRIFHAALALAIIVQLTTSLVMQGPERGAPGDWLFEIHEYAGLIALLFALGVWMAVASRHRGTDAGLLFPWFSVARITALWNDATIHLAALKSIKLPPYRADSPLAAAVHGLGLLLMTAMGLTGAVVFLSLYAGPQRSGLVQFDLEIHKLLANLVWAYLAGHAGLAVIHHFTKQFSLVQMWSLRRSKQKGELS